MNVFIPIIIIGVLVIITVLLMLLDTLIGGNDSKTLTINDQDSIEIHDADTVLNTLSKEHIYLPSACGGKATCGACKFKLIEGGPEKPLPTETPLLTKEEQDDNVRLACQTKVRSNMKIEVLRELLNAKEYRAKVVNIEDLTYDIKLVRLQLLEPDTMDFKPGQYAQIRVPGVEVERAYSIASNPNDIHHIEFIIRLVPKGVATTFVHKALESGDDIIVTGPYGDFFLQEDSDKDIICIAGGSGKAPIRSILSVLKDNKMPRKKVRYFFGARTQDDLYMTDEFKQLEKEFPNFEYIPALSHADDDTSWTGEKGLITDVVSKYYNDLSDSEAYLCGSPGMIDACVTVLTNKNMPESQIFMDKFS